MRDFASSDRVFHDVKVTFPFTESKVFCLLTSAFEGGSNYWIQDVDVEGVPAEAWRFIQDVPLIEDGVLWVSVSEEDGKRYRLDWEAIVRGLIAMSKLEPRHFFDAANDDGDAITGDVFLQCCLFGEVVYG